MIVTNKRFLLGGKVAVIYSEHCTVTISTAKEGVFKKLSTAIYLTTSEGREPVAKLIYTPSFFNTDRRKVHDAIASSIDMHLTNGEPLSSIIYQMIKDLTDKGILTEAINLLG